MSERKKTVAIDFYGVIRSKGDGSPVEGSYEAIRSLMEDFDLIIFTCRTDSSWVRNWLEDNQFPLLKVTNVKPIAFAYVDDHGIRFEGSWRQAVSEIYAKEYGWQDDQEHDHISWKHR